MRRRRWCAGGLAVVLAALIAGIAFASCSGGGSTASPTTTRAPVAGAVSAGHGIDSIEAGIEPKSLELAQYASMPLLIALAVALILAFIMKETYPRSQPA